MEWGQSAPALRFALCQERELVRERSGNAALTLIRIIRALAEAWSVFRLRVMGNQLVLAAVEYLPAARTYDQVLDRALRIGLLTQFFDLNFLRPRHGGTHAEKRMQR